MVRNRDEWSTPARLTASVSVLAAVALTLVSVTAAGDHRSLVVVTGVAGLLARAAGIVIEGPVVVWIAVALLGASGALADAPVPPLFAVGLFAVAEGAYWSHEERFARIEDRGVHRDRMVLLGAIGTVALFVGAAMRLAARDETTREPQYTVVAAVAIVALVLLVVVRARIAQRTTTRS